MPVIAEEEVAAGRIPAHDDTYFLVDPLDGTKEFVRGGDDYTVNIGLIESGVPRLGVVFAPATGLLHGGCVGDRAWVDNGAGRQSIHTRARGETVTAVASKSHLNQATIDYLEAAVGTCDYASVGSSLKFCIVAEGKADIYPRASPTSEWDTAAGHAVLLAAGDWSMGRTEPRYATGSAHSSTGLSSQPRDGKRPGSKISSSRSRAEVTCLKASEPMAGQEVSRVSS